ncbi:hypothetical protein ACFU96_40690 [Streptomyces sp. NPDC057620]|uniref:hypothetical protein n=1 Tax=Streptomyces sp. NPDC057620 TaxID=3346185 RepID=UPI0036830C61
MTRDRAFTDPSCFHATLATLLVDRDPTVPPAAVLGNATATAAHRSADGTAIFGDTVEPLMTALRARGHHLLHRRLREPGELDALTDALRGGLSIITVVDTFHLPHYWVDRGRIHGLHALVLRQFDPADGTVRMTDAVDTTFFDQRVTLASLDAALRDEQQLQTWMRPMSWGSGQEATPEDLMRELAGHAEALDGAIPDGLSGTALVRALGQDIDRLVSARSTPRSAELRADGTGSDRITEVMAGMWSYHHTLRWFGAYLSLLRLPDTDTALRQASANVTGAAQNLLAVRGLVMRCGVSGPDRVAVYRAEIARRLDRVGSDLGRAADALRSVTATFPARHPESAPR